MTFPHEQLSWPRGTVRLRALRSDQPRGPDRQGALYELCPFPGHGACPPFLPSSLPATDPAFLSQWCRFDDDKVTPATLANVLGASAPIYMAFYVKRRLDYKPHTTPSYALARENAVVREREAQAQAQQAAKAREREREREVEDELLATVG